MTDPTPVPVDRAALRILAHPLRSRILAELRTVGSSTATDLAHALGTNSGATSYHVRRLAEVGLVVDSCEGTGRRRVWQAASEDRPLEVDGIDEQSDDDDAAMDWLARDYIQHFAGKAHQWIDARPDWPLAWQEACGLDDHLVLVTEEQMEALQEEIAQVLARYRRVGAGNPQAKRVTYYTCPLPVDPPPRVG